MKSAGASSHRPGPGSFALVQSRQARHDIKQPVGILEELGRPIGVHGDVVPRRNNLAASCLVAYQDGVT